ncbi:AraC family transcriptional regulator [Aquimarina algiphila]|uniref:AraC family transcriptional regulator n=1 Tax=Aquimarina algiphila TaxID=2047982 RepID=UPI0024909A93|nr:AraC family transcriptional regulator [Aquimarina algiphila]
MQIQKLLLYLILIVLFQNQILAQNQKSKIIDSLVQLGFQELYENLETEKDTANAQIYAKAYLQKGKNLDSVFEISKGYLYISRFFTNNYEKRIVYLDSGLDVIKNTRHIQYTAYFHTHKGAIAQSKGDYNKALDYYLEGLEHSKKNNVSFFVSTLQSNIATLKRKLGKYEEAKSIYKKSLIYRKERMGRDSIPYLLTLSNLFTTYMKSKEIDSALYYYNQGAKLSKDTDIESLYILNKGILQYYDQRYGEAIKTLKKGLNDFLKSKYRISYGDHNLIDGYFFLAKSHNALYSNKLHITYLKKIDSIVQKSNTLIPESRPAYIEIIDYYKSIGDKNNQLEYINKLLYNDSIFNNKHKSLSDKLNKEYDTPILMAEKEKLISELETKNNQSYYGLIILFIISISISTGFILYYRKNKTYKTRFEELMNKRIKVYENEKVAKLEEIGIANEVVEMILSGLENFENNKGFLLTNLTSGNLASKLNTNSKYLTKVIKFYRKKSFTHYVNDLRIDYIIDQIKKDSKLQNYTIKALTSEAGFNSTEVFSKSFLKKTGIYPSYFIKQLRTQKHQ